MSLVAKDLEVSYGRIVVLHAISLSVEPGQIVGGNTVGSRTRRRHWNAWGKLGGDGYPALLL